MGLGGETRPALRQPAHSPCGHLWELTRNVAISFSTHAADSVDLFCIVQSFRMCSIWLHTCWTHGELCGTLIRAVKKGSKATTRSLQQALSDVPFVLADDGCFVMPRHLCFDLGADLGPRARAVPSYLEVARPLLMLLGATQGWCTLKQPFHDPTEWRLVSFQEPRPLTTSRVGPRGRKSSAPTPQRPQVRFWMVECHAGCRPRQRDRTSALSCLLYSVIGHPRRGDTNQKRVEYPCLDLDRCMFSGSLESFMRTEFGKVLIAWPSYISHLRFPAEVRLQLHRPR